MIAENTVLSNVTTWQVFRSVLAWCEEHSEPGAFPELFSAVRLHHLETFECRSLLAHPLVAGGAPGAAIVEALLNRLEASSSLSDAPRRYVYALVKMWSLPESTAAWQARPSRRRCSTGWGTPRRSPTRPAGTWVFSSRFSWSSQHRRRAGRIHRGGAAQPCTGAPQRSSTNPAGTSCKGR